MEAVAGHANFFHRGATHHHRCKVPADIVATYGRREETFSLETKDLNEAVRRVPQVKRLAVLCAPGGIHSTDACRRVQGQRKYHCRPP